MGIFAAILHILRYDTTIRSVVCFSCCGGVVGEVYRHTGPVKHYRHGAFVRLAQIRSC